MPVRTLCPQTLPLPANAETRCKWKSSRRYLVVRSLPPPLFLRVRVSDGRTEDGGAQFPEMHRVGRDSQYGRGGRDRGTERRAKKCRCTARQEREERGGVGSKQRPKPLPHFFFFVFSLLPWVAEMDKGGETQKFLFRPPKKLFPVREYFENLPIKAQILTISLLS